MRVLPLQLCVLRGPLSSGSEHLAACSTWLCRSHRAHTSPFLQDQQKGGMQQAVWAKRQGSFSPRYEGFFN